MSGTLAANRGPETSPRARRGPSGSGSGPGGLEVERASVPLLLEWDEDDEPAPPGAAMLPNDGVLGTPGQSPPVKIGCAIELLRGANILLL